MNKIFALHSGSYYHLKALFKGEFSKYIDKKIYLRELKKDDLKGCDILLVTDSLCTKELVRNKELLMSVLEQGKTMVICGRNSPELWCKNTEENIKYKELAFNFWWWLDKENNDIEFSKDDEKHALFNYIDFEDLKWHFHGGYEKLKNSKSAIKSKFDENISIYQEAEFSGGRLILTSLDPFFHHGCHFMPNASKFGLALLKRLKDLK